MTDEGVSRWDGEQVSRWFVDLFQVRDLEERLVEKEHELSQMKRNLDESEGAIAQVRLRSPPSVGRSLPAEVSPVTCCQVFEGKQRLWEKEVEELKCLYAAKLRQVTQHAQRSQRSFQLQLFKAEQDKNRLQEELDSLKREMSREAAVMPKATSPTLEETQWEVRPAAVNKRNNSISSLVFLLSVKTSPTQ